MRPRSPLAGVVAYELRMQLRKRSVWILMGALIGLMFLTRGPKFPLNLPADASLDRVMGDWALTFNLLAPVGFAGLLADRLVRDRNLHTAELLNATPVRPGVRLWGKYLGAVAATGTPVFCALLAVTLYEAVRRGSLAAVPLGLAAFAAVVLPGLALVGAAALALPPLISPALFRVLFTLYWFWGNLLSPRILPSLTGTLLTPVGDYAAKGLFHTDPLWAGHTGILAFLRPDPTTAAALVSIACLLALTAALLAALALGMRRADSVDY